MPTDQNTPNRNYPLPHAENTLAHDVERLRQQISAIDTDVKNILDALALKAATAHTHAIANVVGLQGELDGKMSIGATFTLNSLTDVDVGVSENGQVLMKLGSLWVPGAFSWTNLGGKPTAFPPDAHNHDDRYFTESEVTAALAGKAALGSDNAFTAKNAFGHAVAFSGPISLSLTANQADYAPAGHAASNVWDMSSDAARVISGIVGGYAGRMLWAFNRGSNPIDFSHNDAASTDVNRILTMDGGTARLRPGAVALLLYDGTATRWRMLLGGSAGATAAAMEAAANDGVFVSPAQQHRHPGHPKFWLHATVSGGVPTLRTSYNVTSITDTGTGQLTVTIGTDFSDAFWCSFGNVDYSAGGSVSVMVGTKAAGSARFDSMLHSAVLIDPAAWNVGGLGDQ